jgi:hypothetical protein
MAASDPNFEQFLTRARSDGEIGAAFVDGFYLKRGQEESVRYRYRYPCNDVHITNTLVAIGTL